MAYKAILLPKSEWQKDNCINYRCKNLSTLEAVYGKSRIRCCEKEYCKLLAIKIAVDLEDKRMETAE